MAETFPCELFPEEHARLGTPMQAHAETTLPSRSRTKSMEDERTERTGEQYANTEKRNTTRTRAARRRSGLKVRQGVVESQGLTLLNERVADTHRGVWLTHPACDGHTTLFRLTD